MRPHARPAQPGSQLGAGTPGPGPSLPEAQPSLLGPGHT